MKEIIDTILQQPFAEQIIDEVKEQLEKEKQKLLMLRKKSWSSIF
ncbi:MAG: hypothetical protein AAF960_03370 [Bacteroidota bacterium]